MKSRGAAAWQPLIVLLSLGVVAKASYGDRMPEFKDCVQVSSLLLTCARIP